MLCVTLLIFMLSCNVHAGGIRIRKFPIEVTGCINGKDDKFCTEMDHSAMEIPANFSLFGSDYQSQNRPTTKPGEILQVKISMSIITVHRVSEEDKDVTLEMILRIEWKDPRLNLPSQMKENQYLHLHPNTLDECLWIPDAFIYHLKDLKTSRLLTSAGSLMINSDKAVIYTSQIMLRLGCHMDFFLYPVDTQECPIRVASYGHTSHQMQFSWSAPVTVEDDVNLDEFQFNIKQWHIQDDNVSVSTSPVLEVVLVFNRYLSFHLLQTYIPSALLVIVAWLSLFVPRQLVPGRMVLCMTTLVTLSSMLSAVRNVGPRCSYLKAIDIWMLACIFFVFFSLSQYALILRWHDSVAKSKDIKEKVYPSVIIPGLFPRDSPIKAIPISPIKPKKLLVSQGQLRIDRVEVLCIIVYPILFVIFNLIYWTWILSKK